MRLALASLACLVPPVWADEPPTDAIDQYAISSPYVVEGQNEFELRAAQFRDSSPVLDDTRGYVVSVSHSFTAWWQLELYLGTFQTVPGNPNHLVAHELENTFQLTDQGEYWADVGFLASYDFRTQRGQPNDLEFGPLFEKQSRKFRQTLNLIWEKQVGTDAGRQYDFHASYSLVYLWRVAISPGINVYAFPNQQLYQAGPALSGEFHISGRDEFEYDVALVLGLNREAPARTLTLDLEYEFF